VLVGVICHLVFPTRAGDEEWLAGRASLRIDSNGQFAVTVRANGLDPLCTVTVLSWRRMVVARREPHVSGSHTGGIVAASTLLLRKRELGESGVLDVFPAIKYP